MTDAKQVCIQMLETACSSIDFVLNGVHFGRGDKYIDPKTNIQVTHNTVSIKQWEIMDETLKETDAKLLGVFFNTRTYLVEWKYSTATVNVSNNEKLPSQDADEDSLFFYWKGSKGTKGCSPLPAEVNSNTIVERINQWSEPTVFLRLFSGKFIVHNGEDDKKQCPFHLYIVCGEYPEETRLYELDCKRSNLRTRTSFILVSTVKNKVTVWHGSLSSKPTQKFAVKLSNNVVKLASSFGLKGSRDVDIDEIREGFETQEFLEALKGDNEDYFHYKNECPQESNMRLFYFSDITESFSFTEVENIYKGEDVITTFPFLQTHLYTANQPAIFLLDSCYKVWIWHGKKSEEGNEDLEAKIQQTQELATHYSDVKGYSNPVDVVSAGQETIEFTNLFLFWQIDL